MTSSWCRPRLQEALASLSPSEDGALAALLADESAVEALRIPHYVFDGQISAKLPDFEEELLTAVPEYVEGYDPVLTQFNLGPALTGAQPHFHGDAWNALVYGRKQWFVSPPSRAFFAQPGQRVIDWLRTREPEGAGEEAHASCGAGDEAGCAELVCVQEGGDVVYVPRLWGHAVLNLQQSVGAAVEFEQQ